MKLSLSRLAAVALLAVLAWIAIAAAATGGIMQPDKLVILSTNDVKGETSPCG